MRLHTKVGAATAGTSALAMAATLLVGVGAAAAEEDGPVEAGITIAKIDGLKEDFINGVDVSSVLSLEESGVVFRHDDGTPGDLFEILAEHGVTDVRVRVWNDPYDSEGNGYGGGTVDAERAVEIGERATDAGLHVSVDFHYADFWAHPGQQPAPKAWVGLSVADKADAVYDFTHDTLAAMAAAGVDVTLVQVGNETNSGQVAGASGWANFVELMNGGAQAVREVYPDALVAVHFTNPESQDYWTYAQNLETNGMDYDVFASSYYPYWHGSLANLTDKLYWVAQDFDKQVMVAETSYAYTLEDGDGHENTVRDGVNDDGPYATSVQGQATAVRDVMEAVANVGDAGLGVYYWEPAWLPVGPPEELAANQLKWEEFGSGWAASFAGDYSADAAAYYGGSSWDNQALFAFDGTPLESLNVFEYARTGSIAPLEVTGVQKPSLTVTQGDTITLPSTVTVTYNDSSTEQQSVTWASVLEWITSPGVYTVPGVTEDGLATQATVTVKAVNLIVNGDFEEGSLTGWNQGATTWPGTFWWAESQGNNALGTYAVNLYGASAYDFVLSQAVVDLPAGTYTFTGKAHGQNVSPEVFVTNAAGTQTATATLTGWQAWKSPSVTFSLEEAETITVGMRGTGAAGGWAWLDDFTLVQTPPAGPDTTALEELVDRATGLARSVYSAESLEVLDDALVIARIVLAASQPTEQQVADAATALDAALEALVVVGEVPDPTVEPVTIAVTDGEAVVLPSEVTITLFDGREQQRAVTWDDVLGSIDGPGVYTVNGETSDGQQAIATITVTARQYLVNGDLESGDLTGWSTTATTWPSTFWYSQDGGSVHGTTAVNLYGSAPYDFTLAQVVADLPAGSYSLTAQAHGGSDATPAFDAELSMTTAEGTTSTPVTVTGWGNWAMFTVNFTTSEQGAATVALSGVGGAGDWAFFDDFSLVKAASTADISALENALDEAAAVDKTLYTEVTVDALDLAVLQASVLLQAASPSQAKVDAAAAAIRAAIEGLDLIDVEFTTAPTPTITGTAKVGSKLTANPGTWVPAASGIAYQWNRNGSPIPGAVAKTYVLTKADAGVKITVTVTGSRADYVTTDRTSAAVTVQKIFTKAPKPTISGTPVVGAKLTAKLGTWSPAPTKVTYAWKVGSKVVSTKSTYTVKKADLGKKVTVTVTASRSGYTSVTVTSAPKPIVKRFASTGYASISGTPQVGKVLTAHRGVWKPAPSSFTFQWYRNGVAILGANATTYKLTSADKGKKVTVKVTAKKAGYLSTSHTSSARTVR